MANPKSELEKLLHNIKHAPSEELPWQLWDGAICAANFNQILRYDGQPLSEYTDPKAFDQDLRYLTHACNAYPELVEFALDIKVSFSWESC
jgi:hypothetical protein